MDMQWRVANFGGNANNGTNAGGWYWNFNNTSGNRNQNISRHTYFLKINNISLIPASWQNIWGPLRCW